MATAVKTPKTLVATGTSQVVGGTTTGTVWNMTTCLGGIITANITNAATGPTVGCDFVVQISSDGTTWKEYTRQTAPVGANGVYNFVVDLSPTIMYSRVLFQNNTGQNVTVESFGQELTSIG